MLKTKNQLDQLRDLTTVVADTGDIDAIARVRPVDATTNPSLLLKAAALPAYAPLVDAALAQAQGADRAARVADACDRLSVAIGKRILEIVPGRVSTEVDARLSFDTDATVRKAEHLVALYADAGVMPDRILIKIASTWEGIRAAERLERAGIQTNLTLLFAFEQAVAAAEAGAFLISPFVGRITDWYKARGEVPATPDEDRGVQSVRRIYAWYKRHGFQTVVMGASFRNIDQVRALAGCDRLTVSPDLLEALAKETGELPRALHDDGERAAAPSRIGEAAFRWGLNEDAMATEKLADGIRNFAADQVKLEAVLGARL
ncbi:transaldolase [Coralloluteibacterium thermophilus]|uniref:Transaldolase n=1 Tax=Coralloluteibacterium thermophilum TaxID=2707049 RepID=A0ABV9NGD9_9GAMM